ncbi:MAG TPA: DUF1674 domain-containing protein [Steroidobacteraceae bacterium]|nr:DUF1674 domain-containing protein [Steroidobacteraceae bacterium]
MPNAPSDVVPASATDSDSVAAHTGNSTRAAKPAAPAEIGGPQGPEPTRFGDWEKNGRCVDF